MVAADWVPWSRDGWHGGCGPSLLKPVQWHSHVIYSFSGFFAPVVNAPTLNQATAGNNVAFKFSMAGNQGLDILAANFPASRRIDCKTLAPLGAYQATSPSAKSGLQYDTATNQYIYTWKTEKAWAGSCRQFDLKLNDGTEHLANLKFK